MESESEESERFYFFRLLRLRRLRSAYDLEKKQIVRVGSTSGRINQSRCTFPRFMIGLVLPLLLPTPAIWFSLDHKQNVSDGVVSGIRTLFSLDHKLYAFDDDSYSVARKTNLLASPCSRYSLLLSLVEGEKRRLCLNRVKPLTSQSCFFSSN